LVGDIIREVTGRYPGLESGRAIHETTRRLIEPARARSCRGIAKQTCRTCAAFGRFNTPSGASDGRPVDGCGERGKELRHFLNTRLYHDYRVNRMTSKARRIVADLFDQFFAEPDTLPTEWQVRIGGEGPSGTKPRVIADYIAGMTDRFAIAEHQRFFDFMNHNNEYL